MCLFYYVSYRHKNIDKTANYVDTNIIIDDKKIKAY